MVLTAIFGESAKILGGRNASAHHLITEIHAFLVPNSSHLPMNGILQES